MHRNFGISIAGVVGLSGCGDPAVGEWNFVEMQTEAFQIPEGATGGFTYTGGIEVDKELTIDGLITFEANVSYEVDGETEESSVEYGLGVSGTLEKGAEKGTYDGDITVRVDSLVLDGETYEGLEGEPVPFGAWSGAVEGDTLSLETSDEEYEYTFLFEKK